MALRARTAMSRTFCATPCCRISTMGTHDFLLATSILPRLSVELCNFVTGQTDARLRLDLLESAEPVHFLPGR